MNWLALCDKVMLYWLYSVLKSLQSRAKTRPHTDVLTETRNSPHFYTPTKIIITFTGIIKYTHLWWLERKRICETSIYFKECSISNVQWILINRWPNTLVHFIIFIGTSLLKIYSFYSKNMNILYWNKLFSYE